MATSYTEHLAQGEDSVLLYAYLVRQRVYLESPDGGAALRRV